MAYRRFLALTGSVAKVLYSDKGSNFRGAASELKSFGTSEQERVIGKLVVIRAEFCFNPPLASHQGSSWKLLSS